MTRPESERLAILETQMTAVIKQNEDMAKTQKQMNDTIERIDRALSSGKAFRLGLITALPLGGGGIGAFLTNWLKSGGPTN